MTGLSYHITVRPRHRKPRSVALAGIEGSPAGRSRSLALAVIEELAQSRVTHDIDRHSRTGSIPPAIPPTPTLSPRLAITDEASPVALRSTRNRPRTAMHQTCCWTGGSVRATCSRSQVPCSASPSWPSPGSSRTWPGSSPPSRPPPRHSRSPARKPSNAMRVDCARQHHNASVRVRSGSPLWRLAFRRSASDRQGRS
jgi:hypothetical protein